MFSVGSEIGKSYNENKEDNINVLFISTSEDKVCPVVS
jgi:hypothetical protein